MQTKLKSFTFKLKPAPRTWIVVLPVLLGGFASLSWQIQKTCAYIPKAQQQIRYIRTLNRLQQEIYPDKGIVQSLVELNQPVNLQTESNFYRISAQATKLAVLNHSFAKTKPTQNHPLNPTLKNIFNAFSILPNSQLAQTSIPIKSTACQTQTNKTLNCVSNTLSVD